MRKLIPLILFLLLPSFAIAFDYQANCELITLVNWTNTTTATNDISGQGNDMVTNNQSVVINVSEKYADSDGNSGQRLIYPVIELTPPYFYTFMHQFQEANANKMILSQRDPNSFSERFQFDTTNGDIDVVLRYNHGGSSDTITRQNLQVNSWYWHYIENDGTQMNWSVNNTNTQTGTAIDYIVTNSEGLQLMNLDYAGTDYATDSRITQVYFCNGTLSSSERTAHFGNVSADFGWIPWGVGGGAVADNVTITWPLNDSQYNTLNLTFHYNVNITGSGADCVLYRDGTQQNSSTGLANGSYYLADNNLTASTNSYFNYYIQCNSSTSGYVDSSNVTILIDNIDPTLEIRYKNTVNSWVGMTTQNRLVLWNTQYNDNHTMFFTATDTHLYSVNITSNMGYNHSNNTMNGVTSYGINWSFKPENYDLGVYWWNLSACDGHTKNKIKDFNIVMSKKSIKYDNTEIKSLTPLSNIDTTKKGDRYTFTFTTESPTKQVDIEMPYSCYYQSQSHYKGHFVCPKDNKWVDFEGDHTVTVKDNKITIKSKERKQNWVFNSVGELNCISTVYYWHKPNVTIDIADPIVGGGTYNISLRFEFNHSLAPLGSTTPWINSTWVNMYLNNTLVKSWTYNGDPTTADQSTDTYVWYFTYEYTFPAESTYNMNLSYQFGYNNCDNWKQIGGSCSGGRWAVWPSYLYIHAPAITQNLTIHQIAIGECGSISNVTAFFFNVSEEINRSLSTVDVQGYVLSYVTSVANSYNYSFNFTNVHNYSLCLYPANGSFYVDLHINHENLTHRGELLQRRWLNASNETQTIQVYMLNNNNDDYDVLFTLQDYTSRTYSNYLIFALRQEHGEKNLYRIIGSEITDTSGNVLFSLEIEDVYYIFRVYDPNGDLSYTSLAMQISDLENSIIISSEADRSFLNNYIHASSGSKDLSKSGNVITADYTLNNADVICLVNSLVNGSGHVILGTNCSTNTDTELLITADENTTFTSSLIVEYNRVNYTILMEDYNTYTENTTYKALKFLLGGVLYLLACVVGFSTHAFAGIVMLISVSILNIKLELISMSRGAIFGLMASLVMLFYQTRIKK